MAVTAAWESKREQIREEYERARRLIDLESLSDPPSDPYRSKYKAKEVLKELLDVVAHAETESRRRSLVRALIKYDLGVIATETEEVSLGQECFEDCLTIIGDDRYAEPDSCTLAISALNQAGIIYSGRGDLSKALEYLKRAENVYAKISAEGFSDVHDFSDYFLALDEPPRSKSNLKNLERAHTHTLYYLAQVYQGLEESEAAATYCHSTLKKQLGTDNFDSVDWALNAATLSQFFIVRADFGAGRHHLACASSVLDDYAKRLDVEESTPEVKEEKAEVLRHRSADVARCWARYGLLLLTASRESMSAKDKHGEAGENSVAPDKKAEVKEPTQLPHLLIRSPEVTAYEDKITDKLVTDFEGARLVFLASQRWLNDAKEYYALDNHTSDYIEITQCMSKLYRELAHFETATDRRCKMHKRRADMLEEVIREVSPRFYLAHCRQVLFELGETYSELMDLKFGALPAAVKPQARPVKKINSLVDRAIRHYTAFLDTLRDTEQKFPERFSDDLARPALVAHFCVGRLHSKKVAQDPREQFTNFGRTKEYYEFVLDYCHRVPEHASLVKDELEVMTELLQLIPETLQNMMSSTLY